MTSCAVVTGGTGFTGRRLVTQLVEAGWNVAVLARETSSTRELGAVAEVVRIVRIDPEQRASDVAAAVDQAIGNAPEPPVVFSLATLRTCESLADAAAMLDANVRLPALLAAALARRGGGRLITTASYMLDRGGVAPSMFSASRGAVDPILDWAAAHGSVRVTTLAPTSIYGPGDSRAKVFAAVMGAARSGAPIEMANPDRLLDLIHVDDVARAFVQAAAMPEAPTGAVDRFDVSSGRSTTLRELVAAVEDATGRAIDARWGGRPSGASDAVGPPVSPTWVPGWHPEISLGAGLRGMAEHELGSLER